MNTSVADSAFKGWWRARISLDQPKSGGVPNQENWYLQLFFFILVFFIFQPFLSFVLLSVIGLKTCVKCPRVIYLIAFFGACFLGLVNTTKLPESDQILYFEWYLSAQEQSLPVFLGIYSREPLYYIYLHTIANIPYSSKELFIFVSTIISYSAFMVAVVRTSNRVGLNGRATISIVIALLFFAQPFSLSAHIMRQFVAASLVILFFSERLCSGKNRWWILIAAIFLHYSAFIFVPLAMIKSNKNISSFLNLSLYLCALPIVYFVARSVAYLFSDVPVLGFIFDRVTAEEGADMDRLSYAATIFVIFTVALSFLNLRLSNPLVNAPDSSERWGANAAIIILGVIVLGADFGEGTAEIATRFLYYLYFFVGLSLPNFVALRPKAILPILPICVFSFLYFFFNLQFGIWKYAPLTKLLFAPSWELFAYSV